MKNKIITLVSKVPTLYLFIQLFRHRIGAVRGTLQSVHDRFKNQDNSQTVAVDIGCGFGPQNRFNASQVYGVDLYADESKNVLKAQLGFDALPFEDNTIDYVTAYDLLEHIPRYADLPDHGNAPFIYLMNEIYRVLKKGGLFLSMTPIYPYLGAFSDPTHINIMTSNTLRSYFSDEKIEIANHYGVKTNFEIPYQKMLGQHLIAVLKK